MTVKTIDDIEIRQLVQQVIEFTKCSEEKAYNALYDCDDDVERAVDLIIEESTKFDDWQVNDKGKAKKTVTSQPLSSPVKLEKNKSKKEKAVKPNFKSNSDNNNRRNKRSQSKNNGVNTNQNKNEFKAVDVPVVNEKVESNKWEHSSDYDEWNGEAIEVLNSNSQIALETCDEPKSEDKTLTDDCSSGHKTEDQKYQEIFDCKPQTKPPPRAVRFPLTKPVIFSPDLLSQYPSKNVSVVFGDILNIQKPEQKVNIPPKKNDTYQSIKTNNQNIISSVQRISTQNDNVGLSRSSINEINQLKTLNSGDPGNFQNQFRSFNTNIDSSNFVDMDKLANLNITDSAVVIQPTVSACSPGNINPMVPQTTNQVLVNQSNSIRRNNPQHSTGPYNQNQQINTKPQNQYNKYQVNTNNLNLPPGISHANMINDHNGALNNHQLLNSQVIHQLSNSNRSAHQNPVHVINNEQVFASNSKSQQNNIYYYDQGQGQNQSSYHSNNMSNNSSRGMSNGPYDMNDMKISSTKADNSHIVTVVHPAAAQQHQSAQGQSHHNIHGHLVETSPASYYPLSGMMFMTQPVANNHLFQQHGGPPHHGNSSSAQTNQGNDIGNFGASVPSKHQSSNQQSVFNQNSQYHPHHPHHSIQTASQNQQIVTAHAVAAHQHQMQEMHHKNFGNSNGGANDYKNGNASSFDKQVPYMQQHGGQPQNYHLIIPGNGNAHKQNKSHR